MQNCKARSAYAFIAVCDSARLVWKPQQQAPRSGAVNLRLMQYPNAAPLRGARQMGRHSSFPCAVAHGYKRESATRFLLTCKAETTI